MSKRNAPPQPQISLMHFPFKRRAALIYLAAAVTAMILAACSSEPTLITDSATTEATAEPSVAPTPTPTPKPYEDFSIAAVPPAIPERLTQLTLLLSLVPESYNSALYLDLEYLRSNGNLVDFISPELLGLNLALPSIATGLVSAVAVAGDFQTRNLVTPFQTDFTIVAM